MPNADEARFRALHLRVLQGDRLALDLLVEEILHSLLRDLRRAFHRVPFDLIVDAAEDALLDYAAHPDRFDVARQVPLAWFLRYAAIRNLRNLMRAEERRHAREAKYARDLTIIRPTRFSSTAHGPIDHLMRARVLAVAHDDGERRALLRWLDGVRATSAFADALGITHLSPDEQRREVKRFKDRLLKRLSRTARV
jgi:RNA polymerase sigma-70 factor, ECF subfamily